MWRRWTHAIRDWARQGRPKGGPAPRIGLALSGGFSRSLAHVGVLQVFQEHQIPIHAIAGLSSGAIIASTYASGTPLDEIISTGVCTTFSSYARWTLSRLGLASNERMEPWLRKALRHSRFEQMQTPLAVVATDLVTGGPVVFKGDGDIIPAVRASCAYPGLFLPVEIDGRWLVDGAISVNVPVQALRELGATHVVAVYLHTAEGQGVRPSNMLQVVSQCFAILQDRLARDETQKADLLLEPRVAHFAWNAFDRAQELVQAGREVAIDALPVIESWLHPAPVARIALHPAPLGAAAPGPVRVTASPLTGRTKSNHR